MIIGLSSCGSTKRSPTRTRDMDPRTPDRTHKEEKRDREKMDTVSWTVIDRSIDYFDKMRNMELEKKDVYKIGLLVPFDLDESDPVNFSVEDSRVGKMIQYYAGTKLALQQLEEEGIDLIVESYDSESGIFHQKLKRLEDADLIIGPRDRDDLARTAEFGKRHEIPVISPWLSSSRVAESNPFYIQMIPSVRDHYARIVEHARESFPDERIFLVGRQTNKDMALMNYIQSVAAAEKNSGDNKVFNELFVTRDSLMEGMYAFQQVFSEDEPTVIILPHYSYSEDEPFVYDVVRKLSAEKGLNEVYLYGMPLLLESDKISFEYYHTLNMRIARSSYVDRNDPIVTEFREMYFQEYGDFPSEEAYKGFDITLYCGRNLFNYGTRFQYFLDSYRASLVHTVFDVQKVFEDNDDRFSKIEYLQNKHLYILEFKDYQFQKR